MEFRRIKVDAIAVGPRFRKDLGDVPALAQSINQSGLLRPLLLTPDFQLAGGLRELEAVKLLGWTEVPVVIADVDDPILAEYLDNAFSKPLLLSEAVALSKAVRAKLTAPCGRPGKKKVGNAHLFGRGKTRDHVAKFTGYSARTLERAAAVVEAAEREPDKYAPFVAEMDKSGSAHGVHRKLMVAMKAELLRNEPLPTPDGPFRVLVLDPPWTYDRDKDPKYDCANPYPSMSIEEIKNLPVPQMAADDCILWLWTTNEHIEEAFGIVRHWGFTKKTILTWDKQRVGYGNWLKGATEHCILAVKGSPVVTLTNQTTIIHEKRREHSRKPEAFYQHVESLCPGSKLEMFSRCERPGWEGYGNETQLFSEPAESGLELTGAATTETIRAFR